MKRRDHIDKLGRINLHGSSKMTVTFGEPDPNQFAPLHRRLGIKTFVHRQAIFPDFSRRTKFDPVSRTRALSHLYRENITLASA